jgi:GT2 family glycosyltransferase
MTIDNQPRPSPTAEPAIAVVIPTYNRARTLISCLEQLERQTWTDFEVVVVDDGSNDETPRKVQEYLTRTALNLRFVRQVNSGPARARNVAISSTRSPLILMLGDDILAVPELIENHVRLHRHRPDPHIAGLGLTLWDAKRQNVTRFMRFLESTQFAYSGLLAGETPSWKHFYTSNLSLKTEVLRQNPFCDRFPNAAMEDIELGFRLAQTGRLEIAFLPEALGYHFHPTTFTQACRRMRNIGWSAHLFHELWPETYFNPKGSSSVMRVFRGFMVSAPLLECATRLSAILSLFCSPKAIFQTVLNTHFYLGYKDRQTKMLAASSQVPRSVK